MRNDVKEPYDLCRKILYVWPETGRMRLPRERQSDMTLWEECCTSYTTNKVKSPRLRVHFPGARNLWGQGGGTGVKVKFKAGLEAHGQLSHNCVWFDSRLRRKKQKKKKCLGQENIVNI